MKLSYVLESKGLYARRGHPHLPNSAFITLGLGLDAECRDDTSTNMNNNDINNSNDNV